MTLTERELLRRFVETWRRAGPELTAIRRQELARFDHAANWQAIDALLAAGLQHPQPRIDAGLAEMQRLFLRLARRQGLLPTTVCDRPTRDRN